ncbi:MAG: hypothetical protein J0L87_00840 [Bacteroidetes bacterium]|nr:hypothetical protein [Bacteroidota bacterium]
MKTLIISVLEPAVRFYNKKLMFLTLFISSTFLSIAQDDSPSLGNIKKTAAALKEEQEKMAQEQLIKEIVYISIGFAIVVAIAWVSTMLARKKAKKDAEEKQRIMAKLHGDRAHHGHGHKPRR